MFDTMIRGEWYSLNGNGMLLFLGRSVKSGAYYFKSLSSLGTWSDASYSFSKGAFEGVKDFKKITDFTNVKKALQVAQDNENLVKKQYNMVNTMVSIASSGTILNLSSAVSNTTIYKYPNSSFTE